MEAKGIEDANLETTMRETMAKLETENAQSGGRLFGKFGEADLEFFIFNTPVERVIPQSDGTNTNKSVTDFLAVTHQGFKLIQIDEGATVQGRPSELYEKPLSLKEWIQEQVEYVQKYPQPGIAPLGITDFKLEAAYMKDKEEITLPFGEDSSLYIGSQSTKGPDGDLPSIRLVNEIDPEIVVEIVNINRERIVKEAAEKEEPTASAEALKRANIEAAHKLLAKR